MSFSGVLRSGRAKIEDGIDVAGLRPDSLRKHWLGWDYAFGRLAKSLPAGRSLRRQAQTLVSIEPPGVIEKEWSLFE